MNNNISSIILAAGKGTRMKSELPKVLHRLKGKALIDYTLDLSESSGFSPNIVVAGYKKDDVIEHLKGREAVKTVIQEEQLGTAHAVMQAAPELAALKENVIVLMGDVPLLRKETVRELCDHHLNENAVVTILTAHTNTPGGYGRIIRDEDGKVTKIVEEKDCSEEERAVQEINSGIYLYNRDFLFENLSKIGNNNKQQEYYLTDIVKIAFDTGLTVSSHMTPDIIEVTGVNSVTELDMLEQTS